MEVRIVSAVSILVLAVAFDIYCLADLSNAYAVRYFPPLAWAAIICICTPVGGMAYLTLGRIR